MLRGIEKNQALIAAPASGRAAFPGARLSPAGAVRIAGLEVRRMRPALGRSGYCAFSYSSISGRG